VQGAQIGCRALLCDKNKRKCCKYALVRPAASPAHSFTSAECAGHKSKREKKEKKEKKTGHFWEGMQVFMSM
jgi:hypothetical protein